MLRISVLCAGLLVAGSTSAPSQAPQQRVLPVSADAVFAHAHSGLSLPATLIGLRRFEVRELESPQLDVWGRYRNDDSSELTVYVYRATSGAVPVWFDRAVWAVESRGGNFAAPTAIAPTGPVAIRGSATASGLIRSWSLAGGSYTGTSLLIVPLGDWLVKLRYSTTTGDGAAAEAKLREAFAALGWPATIPAAPAAVAIADCPTPLTFKGVAKPARIDGATTLLGALMGGMISKAAATAGPPATWCRDAARVATGGVYRPDGRADAYLLALSDAGRGAWVAPNAAGALMAKRRGGDNWSIDLVLPGSTVNYPPQDRLPSPERVLAVLQGSALSSASTWGKDQQITVSPGALK